MRALSFITSPSWPVTSRLPSLSALLLSSGRLGDVSTNSVEPPGRHQYVGPTSSGGSSDSQDSRTPQRWATSESPCDPCLQHFLAQLSSAQHLLILHMTAPMPCKRTKDGHCALASHHVPPHSLPAPDTNSYTIALNIAQMSKFIIIQSLPLQTL